MHKNNATLGVALAMVTGIRIGELCALQWSDIDLEKRILTVRKTMQRIQLSGEHGTKLVITEPKSETSKRKIPIPECIIEFLRSFQGKDDEYICSGTVRAVEPKTMQYRFARILKNVKLPLVHFHTLRHMFTTKCVKLGFDIKTLSEILGHSNVRITIPNPNSNTKTYAVPTDNILILISKGRYLMHYNRYCPYCIVNLLYKGTKKMI